MCLSATPRRKRRRCWRLQRLVNIHLICPAVNSSECWTDQLQRCRTTVSLFYNCDLKTRWPLSGFGQGTFEAVPWCLCCGSSGMPVYFIEFDWGMGSEEFEGQAAIRWCTWSVIMFRWIKVTSKQPDSCSSAVSSASDQMGTTFSF